MCCWLPFQRPARPPGASFNGLLIAPGAVEWMEQSQEKSPGTGERAHGDFCTDTDWYHSGNIFGHLCSGANPSKELVSGMAAWALYDLTVGLWLKPSCFLNRAAPCTSPRRGREVLVSNLHSYSRALHLILQFCIKFEIAGWCSLGAASKSRNTLQKQSAYISFFSLFFFNPEPISFSFG